MSLSDKQWQFLQDVARLIQFIESQGFKATGGELHRTMYQQREHLRTGKSKTLRSDHLKKMAIDLFFWIPIDGGLIYFGTMPVAEAKKHLEKIADYWESLHPDNYWLGREGWDLPHFGRKSH